MKHGHAAMVNGRDGTPEYDAWTEMKSRCLNSKHHAYPSYGGRGIRIYSAWVNDFQKFYDYIGPRPSKRHSLDRYPNNDGNYVPGNVRWATKEEQGNNRRSCVNVTVEGVTKTVTEWAAINGLNRGTVYARIKAGKDPVWAVTAPSEPRVWTVKPDPYRNRRQAAH